MKNLSLVFVFCIIYSISNLAVGQSITVRFSGKNSLTAKPVSLDSIYIHNITQSADTTLTGQDTTLVLYTNTGIRDYNAKNSGFELMQNYPNPSGDHTSFVIMVHTKDQYTINLTSMLGQKLAFRQDQLEEGTHLFTLSCNQKQYYILSVFNSTALKSIKLINYQPNINSHPHIDYVGYQSKVISNKSLKAVNASSVFKYSLGDNLEYIGYSKGYINDSLRDSPSENKDYFFSFDKLDFPKEKITGHVQKGPFINGTSITMAELNESLEQTGKIFSSQISDNSGTFEIKTTNLMSNYVDFSANGYYFDEVQGEISTAPLILNAVSDINDISTVNVNILTHLEKPRVEYLVKQNKSFSEAKTLAQSEILAIFGFSLNQMDVSESLDISKNTEENAILLAVSIILQGNRSTGVLTELLAGIMFDVRSDGILNNESILFDLNKSTKRLDLETIRLNLEKRYQYLGINASIPDFEKYINNFLEFTFNYQENSTQPASNITETSATLNGRVNANSSITDVTFEFGTNLSYGSSITALQSPLSGNTLTNVSAEITGLSPNTLYHFRVKAVNALGKTYGQDTTFKTLSYGGVPILSTRAAYNITESEATSGGNIISDGGSYVTAVGICWSTSPNPTVDTSISASFSETDFTVTLSGLSVNTLYYVRAYATNDIGTGYGNQVTFTTLNPAILTLTTNDITSITNSTAISGGNVIFEGLSAVTTRGVCWSTIPNPTISGAHTTDGTGIGSFTSNITGLNEFTLYFVRAYATNSSGTTYGSEFNFTAGTIGQSYQGGLLAYFYRPGDPEFITGETHGLIVAPTDQGNSEWGCLSETINGADGTMLGTGNQNTTDIVVGCSEEGIAAKICYNLVLNGYSDWYLPSLDELTILCRISSTVGMANDYYSYYWSSSEIDKTLAYIVHFASCYRYDNEKTNLYRVRAIRSF